METGFSGNLRRGLNSLNSDFGDFKVETSCLNI